MPTTRRDTKTARSIQAIKSAKAAAPAVPDDDQAATRPGRSLRRRVLAGAAAVVVVFAAGFAATSLAGAIWWTMVAGLAAASVWLWRLVRRHTGMVTATAAVGVAWAVFSGVSAKFASVCPGRVEWVEAGACTSEEVGANALIGLLTPVSLFLVVTPAIVVVVAARWVWRRTHRSTT